jgi:hypothetical protein
MVMGGIGEQTALKGESWTNADFPASAEKVRERT